MLFKALNDTPPWQCASTERRVRRREHLNNSQSLQETRHQREILRPTLRDACSGERDTKLQREDLPGEYARWR